MFAIAIPVSNPGSSLRTDIASSSGIEHTLMSVVDVDDGVNRGIKPLAVGVVNVGAKLMLTVPVGVVGRRVGRRVAGEGVEDPELRRFECVRVGGQDFPNRRRRAVRIHRQRSKQVRVRELLLVADASGRNPPCPACRGFAQTPGQQAAWRRCRPGRCVEHVDVSSARWLLAGTPVLPSGLMFVVVTKMLTPLGTLLKVAFKRVPKSARPAVPPLTGRMKPTRNPARTAPECSGAVSSTDNRKYRLEHAGTGTRCLRR